MKRRDYYFIAGGIFVFLVVVFLTAYLMTRKAQDQQALAQALEAPPATPGDYAHEAVAKPETGYFGGDNQ